MPLAAAPVLGDVRRTILGSTAAGDRDGERRFCSRQEVQARRAWLGSASESPRWRASRVVE